MGWFLFFLWCVVGYWVVAVVAQCKIRNESKTWGFVDKCIGVVVMFLSLFFFFIIGIGYFVEYADKECFRHPLWSWPWYSRK